MSLTLTSADCDYYAGTFLDEVPTPHELEQRISAHGVKWIAPIAGYQQGYSLVRHDSEVARFYSSTARPSYFIGSGVAAGSVMEALREPRLEHRVSRMDAKIDLIPTKGFNGVVSDLDGLIAAKVSRRFIHSTKAGKYAGATAYFGSSSSEVLLRVYDKHAESPEDYVAGTVRIEVQMRPQKERKTWASFASPAALFGAVRWLDPVAEYVEVAGERAPRTTKPKSSLDQRMENACSQWGATFLERLEFYGGDWAALGEEIENRSWNGGKLVP